jgi:GNAT acetyltransferase-like protein
MARSCEIELRILRNEAEVESIRDAWTRWQEHPNADLDFFLAIARIRPEVISPYVLAIYRNEVVETILIGRHERGDLGLSIGYLTFFSIPVRSLTFIYGGLLGNRSEENCLELIRAVQRCLKRERAHLASLHFVKVGSPIHRAFWRDKRLFCQDLFTETRPHWVMKLPSDINTIYDEMSPKARRNRRYEATRLERQGGRTERYVSVDDLDRVMNDAESIARRTYQRGLGVGFVANDENRERFRVEAQRGRFRAYFLYVDERPVAFFLGTLHKNVLYDNFTAYDPEFSKYSPGTYLFFQIFEELCRDGVEAVDFGFGDAWYKAQFGNERSEEITITAFAPTVNGVGLNLIRTPVSALDRLGKGAVHYFAPLRSVKKRWRDWAQRRATA